MFAALARGPLTLNSLTSTCARRLAPLSLVLGCACRTLPERHAGPVTVRGDTPELAERGALVVAESLPRFPVPHEQDVTLVVRAGPPMTLRGEAFTLDANVWIDPACVAPAAGGPDFLAYVAVHELLHLYIRPEERARLPAVLEEGLVDRRTLAVRPDVRAWRRVKNTLALLNGLGISTVSLRREGTDTWTTFWTRSASGARLPALEDVFAIRRAEWSDAPAAATELYTALGWFLWECAGDDVLPELLARAEAEHTGTVRARWICAAAQLDPDDLASWAPRITSLLGPEEQRLLESAVPDAAPAGHAP